MNRAELIDACRTRATDTAKPYLWSDDEWGLYLNEAEREACVRARLIEDTESAAASIDLEVGVTRYPLDPRVIDVLSARLASRPTSAFTGWDLTETHLILDEAPKAADTLELTVVRLPLADMAADGDAPEINARHHYRLTDWALRCAYLKQDADTFDEAKAMKCEAMFERSFGVRPDANVQRKRRRKSARVVRYGGL